MTAILRLHKLEWQRDDILKAPEQSTPVIIAAAHVAWCEPGYPSGTAIYFHGRPNSSGRAGLVAELLVAEDLETVAGLLAEAD